MLISIIIGLLLTFILGLAWVAKKLNDFDKKLTELQRVGVLVTGENHAMRSVERMGRREVLRRIERMAAAKGATT